MATRQRVIYIVKAEVIDANYNIGSLSNYPKKFDSEAATYDSSEDRCRDCLLDAIAEYDSTEATVIRAIKTSGRIIQKCYLETADGKRIKHYEIGAIPDVVVSDQEPEQQNQPE